MATTSLQNYTIDAAGKRLGRVASDAARILLGKADPAMVKHRVSDVSVTITNAGRLHIDERKLSQKTYDHYSGYPGGLKTERLTQVVRKKGNGEIIRRAVSGMLPNNKLRAVRMKRLHISN